MSSEIFIWIMQSFIHFCRDCEELRILLPCVSSTIMHSFIGKDKGIPFHKKGL